MARGTVQGAGLLGFEPGSAFHVNINETVTVSGQLLDASGAAVVGRTVQLEWSGNQATWYPEDQISFRASPEAHGSSG